MLKSVHLVKILIHNFTDLQHLKEGCQSGCQTPPPNQLNSTTKNSSGKKHSPWDLQLWKSKKPSYTWANTAYLLALWNDSTKFSYIWAFPTQNQRGVPAFGTHTCAQTVKFSGKDDSNYTPRAIGERWVSKKKWWDIALPPGSTTDAKHSVLLFSPYGWYTDLLLQKSLLNGALSKWSTTLLGKCAVIKYSRKLNF